MTNVLPHIRFLTMKSEEFVDGPAVSGILQQDETLAILMNLVHPGKCTMPTNISCSRDIRYAYYSPPPSFKNNASVGPSTMRRFLFLFVNYSAKKNYISFYLNKPSRLHGQRPEPITLLPSCFWREPYNEYGDFRLCRFFDCRP